MAIHSLCTEQEETIQKQGASTNSLLGGCSGWLPVGGEGPQKEKNAKTVLRCKVKLEFKYVLSVRWSGREPSPKLG
jgi:hypothetical protein